jgi:hypothetical protein
LIGAIRFLAFTLLSAILLTGPAFAQAVASTGKSGSSAPPRTLVSTSAVPSLDEGTAQNIAAAMLSYSTIEVRGGWPMLPGSVRLGPGARGPDVSLLRERLVITEKASG